MQTLSPCTVGYVAAHEAAKELARAGVRQRRCPHGLFLWVGLQTCADHLGGER